MFYNIILVLVIENYVCIMDLNLQLPALQTSCEERQFQEVMKGQHPICGYGAKLRLCSRSPGQPVFKGSSGIHPQSYFRNNSTDSNDLWTSHPLYLSFYFDSIAGLALATAVLAAMIILKKAKISKAMKYLSLSFLFSDFLFHFVSALVSSVKFLDLSEHAYASRYVRQFCEGFLLCVSLSSVVVLSFDRVIALVWPLRRRRHVTTRRIWLVIICTWSMNLLVYSSSVFWFLIDCPHLVGGRCDNDILHPVKMSLAQREHIILTSMLITLELMNVIANCILIRQIYLYIKKRQLLLVGMQGNRDSNAVTSTTPAAPNTTNDGKDQKTGLNKAPYNGSPSVSGISFVSRPEPQRLSFPVPRLATEIQNPAAPEGEAAIRRIQFKNTSNSIAAAKLIVAVALTQVCFKLPYIAMLQLRVFTWKQGIEQFDTNLLQSASRGLIQISSVPALYLYVLKLRECRRVIRQLAFCGKI